MLYKIQYFNWDEKDEWQDYVAAGTFETAGEAQRRLHEWTSKFKKGRVVPVEEMEEHEASGYLRR